MSSVILLENHDRVALIRINRPSVFNALNDEVMDELGKALDACAADDNICCGVITGSETAFAAGADIAAMKSFDYMDACKGDFITRWERLKTFRKPVIAAVSGVALGGGCELAMMCDLVFAAETTKFGQPEVKLGTLPGAGGTQRLPRAVGKAKAMRWPAVRAAHAARVLRAGRPEGRHGGLRRKAQAEFQRLLTRTTVTASSLFTIDIMTKSIRSMASLRSCVRPPTSIPDCRGRLLYGASHRFARKNRE